MADTKDKKLCFVITPIGDNNSDIRRHIDGIIDQAIVPALVHRIIINWLYLHLILCQPIQLPPDLFHRACMSNGKLPALC